MNWIGNWIYLLKPFKTKSDFYTRIYKKSNLIFFSKNMGTFLSAGNHFSTPKLQLHFLCERSIEILRDKWFLPRLRFFVVYFCTSIRYRAIDREWEKKREVRTNIGFSTRESIAKGRGTNLRPGDDLHPNLYALHRIRFTFRLTFCLRCTPDEIRIRRMRSGPARFYRKLDTFV